MEVSKVTFTLNGIERTLSVGDAFGQLKPAETLLETLRERFGLTGAKLSCNDGACGCCTVLVDDVAVPSCTVLTVEVDGKKVTTIEGLTNEKGELDPLQQAFIDHYAFQCGYCTPGIIMAAKSLLLENPHPTPEEIKEGMSGNYCRCISHYTVLRAINKVAGNGEDHTAVMHRANDDVENPIPVRPERFPSPFAVGTQGAHALND